MFIVACLCFLGTVWGETVAQVFPPPPGSVRVQTDAFGRWLVQRPLRAATEPVRTHDGRVVGHSARVVDLPMVPGDLQQCADSAIRLRAEWLRERGAEEIVFKATSGDDIPWSRYRRGERPYTSGGRIRWRRGAASGSWEGWLSAVFTWAGTRSLSAYETVAAHDPRGGDLLVEGGSPGHAVVVLDVARNGDDTWVLVGEGFMPAQDFHVELGPNGGWWSWTEAGLALPHWPMSTRHLRRWKGAT